MNQFLEALIATMISFVPPGFSAHSQIPIPVCDEQCQQTPLCDNPTSWRCKPPILNTSRQHDMALDYANTTGASYDEAMEYAKPYSFTRPETYEEGLARYYVIASAARAVSLKMNQPYCKSQCAKLKEEKEVIRCHKSCRKSSPWVWTRKELEYLIITVIKLESGYRADVHGGTPPKGRGDCTWERDGKRVAPWSKDAYPVMKTCRSVCLGQINLGTTGRVSYMGNTWYANDLPGVDFASTERCLTAVAKVLSRSRLYCNGPLAPRTTDWAAATFSMYGSGNRCDSEKLMKRSGSFWTAYNYARPLQPKAVESFKDLAVTALIQQLMNAHQQTLWMLPLPTAQPTPAPNPKPSVLPEDLIAELNGYKSQSASTPLLSTYTLPASP